jgi:hypothetical protein
MKPIGWCFALMTAVMTLLSTAEVSAAASPAGEMIVCGWDEIYILNMGARLPKKVWSWKAAGRPDLPEALRTKFQTTDECKPVDGGRRILITSSGGGVALVERAAGKVLFYASVGSAHSAEMLPGNRIAVAGSTGKSPLHDRLVLFDAAQSGRPLFDTELASGHGAVWDDARQLLWTLSGSYLRTYRLVDWGTTEPKLGKVDEYTLPSSNGHDLIPIPGTDLLSVTTVRDAYVFDRARRTFAPHPQLAGKPNVKSVSVNPVSRQIAWTQADEGFWWTATIRFLNPVATQVEEGARRYKVRWVDSSR